MKSAMKRMIEEYTFTGHLVSMRSKTDRLVFKVDFKALNEMVPSFNNSLVNPTTDKLDVKCEYGGYSSNDARTVAVSTHSRISATFTMADEEHGAVNLFQKLMEKVDEVSRAEYNQRKAHEYGDDDGDVRANSEAYSTADEDAGGEVDGSPGRKRRGSADTWDVGDSITGGEDFGLTSLVSTRATLARPTSSWRTSGRPSVGFTSYEADDGGQGEDGEESKEGQEGREGGEGAGEGGLGAYWTDDLVKIIKAGSLFAGDLGQVTDPDWNGMVKVVMTTGKDKGKTKSYKLSELEPVRVAPGLAATGAQVILHLPKVGSFRGKVVKCSKKCMHSYVSQEKKFYKMWHIRFEDGDEDEWIESEVQNGLRLASEVATYEREKQEEQQSKVVAAPNGAPLPKSKSIVAEYLDLSKVPSQKNGDRETKRDHTSALSLYSALDALYTEFYENRSADGVALQVVNTGLRVAKERLIDTRTAKGQATNTLKAMFEIELETCLEECKVPTCDTKDQLVGRKFLYQLAKNTGGFLKCFDFVPGAARWFIFRNLYRAFEVLGVYIRAHKEILGNIKKDKELARVRLAILHRDPKSFSDPEQEEKEYTELLEGLNVRQKAIYNSIVMAEDRMAALIEQYPRVNLFQELVFMVRERTLATLSLTSNPRRNANPCPWPMP